MDAPPASQKRALFVPKSTWRPALVSSLLAWLAFPPVGWSLLAWVAPMGWLSLIAGAELPGRRPYRALWLAGFVFWVLVVHWIRLPHPANYLALVVLASYLGCYVPVFVALSRVGVQRVRLPLALVAPVVWTGLDWVRNHLMTGFGFGSLAQTQVGFLEIIQIADLVGEYGVTFLIMLVAACLTNVLMGDIPAAKRDYLQATLLRVFPGLLLLGATVVYGIGVSQTNFTGYNRSERTARAAIIQGNTLADWKGDADKQQRIMQEYLDLSLLAVTQSKENDDREVDLIIWPETSFRQTLATVAKGYQPPPERVHESYLVAGQRDLAEFVRQTGAAILTGIDRVHLYADEDGEPAFEAYNSSVLMNRQQQIVGTYDKMHRVPFGEFIPLAEWFPVLYRLTPLTGGVSAGEAPTLLEFGELLLAPNICYETCVPHLIRQHVNRDDGRVPDVLVNLTNDAWYWGSSELDMHLACGVLRAVEQRRPLVIAANGGLSAHIGPSGTVLDVTERQKTATLLVDLRQSSTAGLTFYARWSDWFAVTCVVCCLVFAVIGGRPRSSAVPGDV